MRGRIFGLKAKDLIAVRERLLITIEVNVTQSPFAVRGNRIGFARQSFGVVIDGLLKLFLIPRLVAARDVWVVIQRREILEEKRGGFGKKTKDDQAAHHPRSAFGIVADEVS